MIGSLEAAVLARSSSQQKYTYEADASLSEYELTKILLDKMDDKKITLRVDYKKSIMITNEKDKDQDPSTGSNRGTKRRKSSKDAESSRDPKFKESKSTSSSKGTSRSQHKSSGKSAHAEEPSYIVDDSGVQKNQSLTRHYNPLQSTFKSLMELEYHLEEIPRLQLNEQNPEGKTFSPFDLRKAYRFGFQIIEVATYEIKWIEDMVLNLWSPVKESRKDVYSRKRIITVTRLMIMKRYDYGYLDEIEVRRDDKQLYTFKEGDFPRLRLQDIEDMLLLLV
ncbi:hypothetical protein Tco_0138848 [Tanacetum coccineum]